MELEHSRRFLLQTTHAPIVFEGEGENGDGAGPEVAIVDPGRPAIERAAVLRFLGATRAELKSARARAKNEAEAALFDALASSNPLDLVRAIDEHDPDGETLPRVFGLVADARKAHLSQAVTSVRHWTREAEQAVTEHEIERSLGEYRLDMEKDLARAARIGTLAVRLGREDLERLASEVEARPEAIDAVVEEFDARTATVVAAEDDVGAVEVTAPELAEVRERLEGVVAERLVLPNGTLGNRVEAALAVAPLIGVDTAPLESAVAKVGVATPLDVDDAVRDWAELIELADTMLTFEARQPIGYLHLERLSFVPAGVEHGELVYSLPLAPGEEVSISHKEWSNTEEEFQRLIADQFEDFSEEGVVEKTEMSESAASQKQHSTAFSVAVSASGGYGPVSASVNSSYQAQSSFNESRQRTLNRNQEITKKASSRSKKEHRVSFKLATKSQVEDETVRRIKNPDPIHPVRFDYMQLMRKWRVNVHRYGVRLTYDITIPEPAVDLVKAYDELAELEQLIDRGFEFDLGPQGVTRYNWIALSKKYGVKIDPPPPLFRSEQKIAIVGRWDDDERKKRHMNELHVTPPDGYKFAWDSRSWHVTWLVGEQNKVFIDFAHWHGNPGATGDIGYSIVTQYIKAGLFSVRVWFALEDAEERAWEAQAYELLREAAHTQYLEKRQMLQERRAQLLAELAGQDALTLRKLEREELMKGMIRWLFGPGFRFDPPGAPADYFDSTGAVVDNTTWSTVLNHGDLISFLHQAVEWENVNYFLYPYFWTPRTQWRRRLTITHPDPVHEAFLRSGAARIVLPIRPDWERAFLSVLATGSVDGLEGTDHPYMTIATEIENFAKTNYPGIIPANPEDIDPEEATEKGEGVLIGSWFEYTPTSALDIRVAEPTPVEGEAAESSYDPVVPSTEWPPINIDITSTRAHPHDNGHPQAPAETPGGKPEKPGKPKG